MPDARTGSQSARSVRIGVGPLVRLLSLFLGGLLAYSLWLIVPIPGLSSEVILISYWLFSIGLLMILTNTDPLRIGLGLLTMANGMEAAFAFMEQSLFVVGLLGVADIVLALAINICAERWLQGMEGEGGT